MNYLLSLTEKEMRDYIEELFTFQVKNLLRELGVADSVLKSEYMGRNALADLAVTLMHVKKKGENAIIFK